MPASNRGLKPQHGASRIIPAIPHSLARKARPSRGRLNPHDTSPQDLPKENSLTLSNGTNAVTNYLTPQSETPNGFDNVPAPASAQLSTPSPLVLGASQPTLSNGNIRDSTVEQQDRETAPEHTGPHLSPLPQGQTTQGNHFSSHSHSSTSGPDLPSTFDLSNPPPSSVPRRVGPYLVFGGHRDSSTSSPTPHVNGNASNTSHPAMSTHSAVQPAAPPFVPNGHAYHFSEPYASPAYAPPVLPGPNPCYQAPHHFTQTRPYYPAYYQLPQSNGRPDAYSFPPRFQPSHQRPYHFYQPPLISVKEPSKTAHETSMDTQTPNQQPQPGRDEVGADQSEYRSPHESHTSSDIPLDRDTIHDHHAAAALGFYLHKQFGYFDFADSLIRFEHSMNIFTPDAIAAHTLILARSPKLGSFMAMQDRNVIQFEGPRKTLHVTITDRFLSNKAAFVKAIHRLYAEPLPDIRDLPDAGEMYFALSFAAAGHFLQVDEIVSRGLDLATSQLRWDTVNKALAFALDGGLSASWVQRDSSSEDFDSSSSFEDTPSKLGSPTSAPTYGFYSDRLLHAVLDFLVSSCPNDFKFLPDAPQLADSPRLPHEAEQKRSRSSSRLSRIRFGELTLDGDAPPPNLVFTTLSSILVSLPFPILKYVLEHAVLVDRLGKNAAAEIMRCVIEEREQRRRRISYSKANAGAESALEERLWQNVRWAEATESSQLHPSGLKIVRRRLGGETPTSSQSAAS